MENKLGVKRLDPLGDVTIGLSGRALMVIPSLPDPLPRQRHLPSSDNTDSLLSHEFNGWIIRLVGGGG